MTIVERIESKQAKIAKLRALIQRKREAIAKTTDSYRAECLEDEIEDREKDIKYLEKEIADLKPTLDTFLAKKDMIADLRKVLGPFMDDLEKSWNEYDEMMLNKVTPRYEEIREIESKGYDRYFNYLASLSAEQADEEYWKHEDGRKWYTINERAWASEWKKRDYCRHYANQRVSEDVVSRMNNEFHIGWKRYVYYHESEKPEMLARFLKDNHDAVESLVLDLQNRIAYKVGEITDYSHLTVGMKALNGSVTGKLGSCRVESILAGGYNIQRLHVRVLVK